MKTADLIPFILIELNEKDKYGFELTKDIETKSNGKIVIKQPTLYTVLKKLEKSKFISSYWQDSEIGGKRHYYKLTDNGRMQLSTLPSFEVLLNNLEAENEDEQGNDFSPANVQSKETLPETEQEKIQEDLLSLPTPLETILPTEEVFEDKSIDTQTEVDINLSNITLLQTETKNSEEEFASSENVSKFTEKSPITPPETVNKSIEKTENSNSLDIDDSSITCSNEPVKFMEYVNLKKSSEYSKSKKITKRLLLKAISTSLYMLVVLSLSAFICSKTGTSSLFYSFFIIGLLIAIFYPIRVASNMENLKDKILNNTYKYDVKKSLFISASVLCSILVLCLVVNISIGNGSILKIFAFDNFANFYAPVLITCSAFIDCLFGCLLIKKS